MRKILGINFSHNVSFAYFENNILKEYYEEDRFNKIKNFEPPAPFSIEYKYKVLEKFKDIVFDSIAFVSFDRGDILLEKPYIDNILKQVKFRNFKFYNNQHHIFHAISGFYFSNFDEAICVTCDGGGEILHGNLRAMECIFYIKNKKVKELYKHHSNAKYDFFNIFKKITCENDIKINDVDIKLSNKEIGGLKYLNYLRASGFKENEEGQLMGIAAYKNKNTYLDKKVLEIANKAQVETLQERIELIEKALNYSNCKNIVLSGGYHLNCSNNFKLVKHFPKLNFFVDPIAHDGGTAVGVAAYEAYYKK
jgi:predicted NodU family carbamoyl transferase